MGVDLLVSDLAALVASDDEGAGKDSLGTPPSDPAALAASDGEGGTTSLPNTPVQHGQDSSDISSPGEGWITVTRRPKRVPKGKTGGGTAAREGETGGRGRRKQRKK